MHIYVFPGPALLIRVLGKILCSDHPFGIYPDLAVSVSRKDASGALSAAFIDAVGIFTPKDMF